MEALVKISTGENSNIKQADIHPVGSYFGRRRVGDENLDFRWGALKIFNFVRAISDPGPCARIWLNGQEYAVKECQLIPDAPVYISTIGEVVGRNSLGITVKVGDSTILITKIRKIVNDNNTDYEVPSFRIGTRFEIKGKLFMNVNFDMDVCISPNTSIRSGIEVIDRVGLRVALVVDTSNRLLGIVTDGDVRRGLLRGLTIENKISEIMNRNPLTVQAGTTREKILNLLGSKQLLAVPVLKDEIVVGLETFDGSQPISKYNNPVF